MDFFEHQAAAKRNTRVLVLSYVLAVLGVAVAVDLVLALLWSLAIGPVTLLGVEWGAVAALAVILFASLMRILELREGGDTIARWAGARRVKPGTRDPLERRLLNVVDEMAIAAGLRVPNVYVMDAENGVNAFAAGYNVSNAVVAVTRGTLETLNRDELQGMIGHEFSHILNGDMGLNTKMMGILGGIVFIGAFGQFLVRNSPEGEDLRVVIGMVVLGGILFALGSLGLLFARMIKAAVSRQREFLADASSVQFTRNPDGIAGALDQIKVSGRGTLIANRYAEDMSHMFFGEGIRQRAAGLLDTHPPIEERITRVHPGFKPEAYRVARPAPRAELPSGDAAGAERGKEAAAQVLATATALAPVSGRRVADSGTPWKESAGDSAKRVGTTDGDKLDYATRLLDAIPTDLREKLRDPIGARATVIALLLAPVEEVMQGQLNAMKAAGLEPLASSARALEPSTRKLGPAFHLAVIDLAMSAVKGMHEGFRRELVAGLEALIHADRRVTLHEFVVLAFVRDQLAPAGTPRASTNRRISELQSECALMLSLVAHAGVRPDATGARLEALRAALRAGATQMGIAEPSANASALNPGSAGLAISALKTLAPMQKALLVKGLFAAVTADGTITMMEAELLRLAGAVLDCPLPPLLTEIDPATLAA